MTGLAEAARARLAAGHNRNCYAVIHAPGSICTCGHDALRAALEAQPKPRKEVVPHPGDNTSSDHDKTEAPSVAGGAERP